MKNDSENKNSFGERIKRILEALKADAEKAAKSTRVISEVVLVIGILFLILFSVQSIRLAAANKRTRAAETLAKTLQEQMEETEKQGESDKTPDPTPTVAPTEAPTPTPEPIPDIYDETGKRDYYLVCLDAGHGGKDGGAVLKEDGRETRIESVDNLVFALMLRDELLKRGIHVVMTREDDTFLELGERTYIANSKNVDLMISSHRNSYYEEEGKGNESAHGVEIWVHGSRPADVTELASKMLSSLEPIGITKNRGVKFGTMEDSSKNYAINKYSKMGSMIIELGFVTSYMDNSNLDKHGAEYAAAFAEVIEQWLKEHISLEEAE